MLSTAARDIYRRVIERRVYDNGGSGSSYTSRMTISKPEDATSGNLGYVVVEQRDASGALLTKEQDTITTAVLECRPLISMRSAMREMERWERVEDGSICQ